MKNAPQDVSRRRIVTSLIAGGAAAGAGLAGASTAHAAPLRTAKESTTNVKDAAFGAAGDGQTDDTAAIQAAIDDAPDGGTVFFPPGRYLVQAAGARILAGRSGLTFAGSGAAVSTLVVGGGSAATRVLELSRDSNVEVRDLGFDASGNAAALAGVYASSPEGQSGIAVRRCSFTGFMKGGAVTTAAAVYIWPADGVDVEDSSFVDCGRGITIDQPVGQVRVSGNDVSTTDAANMATGIYVRRATGVSQADVVISDNTVRGARLDPSGVGAEGHGIAVYRCQDVRVLNNHSEGNGRGILISTASFGAVVQGNTVSDNNDAGIRVEPEITSRDISVGAGGVRRGVTIVGNVSHDNKSIGTPTGANTGIGITASYAAGSTISGNVVSANSGDGIHCDSDRVVIVGNVVFDNWTGYTAEPTNGRRGGIRLYAGSGCTVVGNQCFDNQSTKTQKYGLSMSGPGGAHVVHGNAFTGNGTGEVFGVERIVTAFFGATPVSKRPNPGTATAVNTPTVLNNLIRSLRELGLVT